MRKISTQKPSSKGLVFESFGAFRIHVFTEVSMCFFVCLFVWLSWVFVALRGLSCGKGGYSIVMCRLLIAVASLMEHGLSVHRLSSVALGF